MPTSTEFSSQPRARILAIEDELVIQEILHFSLGDACDLEVMNSAEAGLSAFAEFQPDLVLMDIGLPGVDGYEACRRLRESSDVPVMFVSSREDLEDRLMAFDAGGSDFIVKPFEPPILLRKVQLAIQQKAERDRLNSEKESLRRTAREFLTDVEQRQVLLDFLRTSMACSDYEELAARLLEAVGGYGIRCHVRLRYDEGVVSMTPAGLPTALEESVLDQVEQLGAAFRFQKRLVTNVAGVTLLVHDLPEDEVAANRIQDNLSILAEGAQAILETIGVRKESAQRAEASQVAANDAYAAIEVLRDAFREQQQEMRVLLQGLIEGVENTYYSLGLTEGQEERISQTLRTRAEEILQLFGSSQEFSEAQFSLILDSLAPPNAANDNALF